MKEQVAIQRLLSRKLIEARMKNEAFSLRAFARKLGLSSSAVSEILNGKRMISLKLAQRITTRLSLDPKESESILSLFPAKKKNFRSNGGLPLGLPAGEIRKALQLSVDEFHAVSDWHHFAILSLLETHGAKTDSEWIAKRLGIAVRDADTALERLERLQMLSREKGKLVLTGKSFNTTDDVKNLALRKTHAQDLDLAKRALDIDDLGIRDFSAMTMAIDTKRIPEAKKIIREFRDRLSIFLEQGKKVEVYKLCIQLIPLSKEGKRHEHS